MSDGPASKDLPSEGRSAEHLPYGVDTIVLRIEWPVAPVARGYNGRVWRMRPLRGWTGGRADQGAAVPIADRVPGASNGGTEPTLDAGAGGGTVPNAAPPPLDPNHPFVVDRRYDDALRRVQVTPPHFGIANAPVPAMPDGNYQHGLAYLMLRIASAWPEDLPQLRADINALYLQPGAHRTGEALIRATEDAAEAEGDLQARREILNDIASIAKSDPSQLAADEFGLPGAVLAGGGENIVGQRGQSVASKPKAQLLRPFEMRFSQRTAGGAGRVQELRPSMAEQGWNGPPIDAVRTPEGIVAIDNTRVALAQEFGIKLIPVRVWNPSDPLPPVMIERERFGPSQTWGEALAYWAGRQRPPLDPTGTTRRPRLPGDDQ